MQWSLMYFLHNINTYIITLSIINAIIYVLQRKIRTRKIFWLFYWCVYIFSKSRPIINVICESIDNLDSKHEYLWLIYASQTEP